MSNEEENQELIEGHIRDMVSGLNERINVYLEEVSNHDPKLLDYILDNYVMVVSQPEFDSFQDPVTNGLRMRLTQTYHLRPRSDD